MEVENTCPYFHFLDCLGRRPGRKSPLLTKVSVILDRSTCQKTEGPISAKVAGTSLRAGHGALVTSLLEQVPRGGGEWDDF